MRSRPSTLLALPRVALIAILLAGCAALEDELARRWPTATVESARVAGLGFDAADLVLNVRIDNPNPLGVTLAGLDYDLRLDGRSLLSGDRGEDLTIPADDSARVRVPLRVGYAEIGRLLGGLEGRDRLPWTADVGLRVDVPVLGSRRIPVRASGDLPVVRAPAVEVRRLRVESLDWSGARAVLELGVDNPNAFGLALRELRYGLRVNGNEWATGAGGRDVRIPAGRGATVALPLSLDFGAIGREAYRVLTGEGSVRYELDGALAGVAGNELLGGFDWSFRRDGRLPVTGQ